MMERLVLEGSKERIDFITEYISAYEQKIKIANKNKCAKGLVEVLTKVYTHVKDKNTFPENPSAFENNKFITFIVK